MHTRGIIDLCAKCKTITLIGGNPGEYLHDFALAERFCPCTQSVCWEWWSRCRGIWSVCTGTLASPVGAIMCPMPCVFTLPPLGYCLSMLPRCATSGPLDQREPGGDGGEPQHFYLWLELGFLMYWGLRMWALDVNSTTRKARTAVTSFRRFCILCQSFVVLCTVWGQKQKKMRSLPRW